MHAVACNGLLSGLVLLLLAPLGQARAVMAGVGAEETGPAVVKPGNDPLGRPAPDFELPSLRSGNESIRLSDYRGKIVYLDFWSSWCAPCRRAMPHLDTLRQEFSRADFEVIGVNTDLLADDAREFLEHVPVSYPIARDPGGRAARRFGVEALPALLVIDRAGVVRRSFKGGAVEAHQELRATLTNLVGEREVQ